MKSRIKPLLLAGLMATIGFTALAQGPAGGEGGKMMWQHGGMHEGMHGMDPAKMQDWMNKRQAELKALLKLTPAQEGAWATYTAAMKPPTNMADRRAEMDALDKLPTPERIDKMKALRTQHQADMNALMDKHGEATKAFYATLTPVQKKIFDDNAMRHDGHGGREHGKMGGTGMGGKGPAPAKP